MGWPAKGRKMFVVCSSMILSFARVWLALKEGFDRPLRTSLGCPSAALPPAKRPFIDRDQCGCACDRQTTSATFSEQPFAQRNGLWPRLATEVTNDRGILVDVGLTRVLLPPHPRLCIDANDSRCVDLAVPQHLPTHLELTPKARVRFELSFLSTDGQAPGNAR